ncbi:mucin-17-like isoform X2 [Asterias rubens]|uniref:mucin-17-like isoform X2 n=1 Tax=Asterias rubens TaxID=7604 RepID=UPI001455B941|nr:mucin-17-like isoform X2 [Asterias rubens]
MTASLVLAFALAIVSGQSYAQEMCAVNQCSNGENCYNRPGSAEGFVCECNLPFRDNYNCAIGPDNQEIYTCYGSTCTSGTFVSKDYPNNYPNRYRALYLLYIPGASGITFTFNSPFGIEADKDELYIGKGLSVDFNLLQGTSTVGPDVRFFEGIILPSDFTIDNTDVAWLYFITDKNIQFSGFSVQYRMVDQSPPVISNCPTGVTLTSATAQAQQAFWVAPTATDAETFTTVSSHVPGQTFSIGTTPVTYTFTDLQGNQAMCTFNVNVIQIDNQPPTITVPAEDVTITVPFGTPGTNVNWVEPQATDNSGSVFTSRTHVPGSFFNVGDTVVTYTFVDPLGNAVTAPFTVRVVELADTIDPVIFNFPEDVTVTVPFGTTSANVPWDTPVVTDNSGTVFPTTNRQPGSSFPPGTTPVTYTFTDPAGNSVTRTFNVNVIVLPDSTDPFISSFPDDITVSVPFGTPSTPVNWEEPTAFDNSGTVFPTKSAEPGSSFPTGQTTPVTYTFTDPTGNSVTRQFTVTVVELPDGIDPFIVSFPDDITVSVPFGTQSTPVNWDEPTAFDNSGTVFPSKSAEPGSSFPTGQTTPVTYTFTDPTGNSVTRQFTVTVVELPDGIPPLVSVFPEDITRTVPFGTTSVPVTWDEPTVTDNSGTVTPSSDRPSGSSFLPGTTSVTYNFVDPTGNSVTRSFNVNVIVLPDSTDPFISSFPDDITVSVPFGTPSTPVNWEEPTAFDNSGTVFPTKSAEPGSSFPTGQTTPVTYTFTDPTGNSVTRQFTVTVVELPDGIDPFIVSFPDDITVSVPFGTQSTPVNWDEPTAFDNSGTVFPSKSAEPGSSFPTGQTTPVAYTFTDPTGNSVTRQFTVTVVELPDGIPPVVSVFPEDITRTVPFGTTSVPVTWDEPTVTDNSGTVTPSSDRPSGSSFLPGTTSVTYNFVDPTGNSVTRSFNVNVIVLPDSIDPFIVSFPDDITVSVPFGTQSTPVNWEEPTAFDNSGTVFPTKSAEPGSSFPTGQTTPVTYTFTDPTGNSVTRQFTVTVVELPDGIPPVVSVFPEDITRTVPFGTTSVPVTWDEPTVTDNSGTVTPSSDRPSGSSFLPGTTPVTYNFVDPTGNSVTRSFNVNVIVLPDSTDPFISSFPDDITVSVPFGTPSTPVNWEEPTAFDNSGTVFPTKSAEPGSSFPTGQTTPVTYTFTDPTGNSVTRQFTVTVVELPDGIPPVVSVFPEDITRTVPFGTTSVPVTWDEPTVTDNSGTVTPSSDRPSGSSFLPGTTPVTYNFVDPTGNSVTRSFNVNVIVLPDSTDPFIVSFPDDITVSVPFGTPSTPVNWEEPTAFDNSGTVFPSKSAEPGSSFPTGQTTPVTYTFTDPTGNSVTRQFTVTVVELPDGIPPVVSVFPEDITRTVPFGTTSVPVTWDEPTVTDNSGTVTPSSDRPSGSSFLPGTTPVTYNFVDPTGNSVTRSFNVNVIVLPDAIRPVITATSDDVTVTVPFQSPGTTVDWTEPTATDNSGSFSTTKTNEPGTFFPTGSSTLVTYTFTDAEGNFASTTFTVRVIEEADMVSPMLLFCQMPITYTVVSGMAPVPVSFTAPSAADNSGNVNLLFNTKSPGDLFAAGATTVEYRFGDQAGNTALCTFVVTIVEANPCGEQPCLNGAACVPETLTTYRCICPDCYSGDNCEIARDACQGNTCQNGAVCAAQPGSCTQYECQCPACYTGQSCQTLVNSCDNNQCANGAACAPAADGCVEYTCQCPPCFTGRYCTIPISACDSSSCQNGAVCMPSTQNPNTAYACSEYKCSCTNCFTGVFCESQRDACNPNPCVNGGVCSATSGSCTSYSCECPPCFSGFNCEISVPNPCDNNPCLNNGVCSTVQGSCGAHTCACPDTHIGLNCESPVVANPNPCNSFPCKNGATCLTVDSSNYICMCAPNYVGPNCLTPKAQQPQMDLCQNTPCNNGANCYNSYNSNTGTNSIPQYSCVCASGFTGSNCNIQTGDSPALDICNKAERPPCRQGAVCSNTFHSIDQDVDYFCACPVGYSGHNCQTESVDPCASNPCRNGANCASFNTYFMCECLTGFGGTTCDSRIGDTTAPVISGCPASIFTNAGTQSFSTVTWTAPTATDESGVVFQTFASHQPGQQFPVGATPVTYVFSDLSQNYARCVFFVTVSNNVPVTPGPSDNTPPVISNCPMGASATAPSGSSGTEAIWVEPTATDDSLPLTVVRSHTPGAFFPLGVTDVTYTISDAAGNSAECKFVVMINSPNMPDRTAPVISNCPENQVVNTNTGSASVSWAEPTAVDDSGQTPGLAQSHVPPASFPVNSVTRVTYIFYDNTGNFDSCTFTVAVQPGTTPTDMTPPVISNCPSDTIIPVASGTTSATVNWVEPTATDGDGLTPTVARSHAPNTAFPLGPTVVNYIFRDSTGNEANCNFIVTVAEAGDTTDPVFTNCPNNIVSYVNGPSATASIDFPTPTAVDNSGVPPVVSGSVGSPHTMGVGSVTASYVARDGSGNEATCTFSISVVVDNQAPVISGCPANQVGTLASGSTSVALSWVEPTATDNSGAVSTSRTHQPGQSFSEGETTVTYTFSDSAGNQDTCSFLITVNAASTVNPCSSSPCPVSQDCYYRSDPVEYLCLPTLRRRRDANQEECLCKNGGVCADNDEGFSCACPSNFTGIICEEEVKITKQHTSDLNTLEVFHSTSSYFEWMMGSVMAILGVIIIILALTICRMAPRTSSKLDSVDKASLVY